MFCKPRAMRKWKVMQSRSQSLQSNYRAMLVLCAFSYCLLLSKKDKRSIPVLAPGGGALVFEVGYHPRKKIHVIRVVFQDQAMYARTSVRGAKTCKIAKKGVFLVT